MRSLLALSTLVFSGCMASAAVGTATTGGGGPSRPAPARASNVTITTALGLAPGRAVTVPLSCGSTLYFGPFAFAAEPQNVAILSDHRSLTREQVCGSAVWVDKDDVIVGTAGIGCAEGERAVRQRQEYAYAPSAGNNPANPIYLKTWVDGTMCGHSDLTLTMQ